MEEGRAKRVWQPKAQLRVSKRWRQSEVHSSLSWNVDERSQDGVWTNELKWFGHANCGTVDTHAKRQMMNHPLPTVRQPTGGVTHLPFVCEKRNAN